MRHVLYRACRLLLAIVLTCLVLQPVSTCALAADPAESLTTVPLVALQPQTMAPLPPPAAEPLPAAPSQALPNLRAYRNDSEGIGFRLAPRSGLHWGSLLTVDFAIGNFGSADLPAGAYFEFLIVLSPDAHISADDHLWLRFYFDGELAADTYVHPDSPIAYPLPAPAPALLAGRDTLYVGMILDWNNLVTESDENDNLNVGQFVDWDSVAIGPTFVVELPLVGG